jgi:hypothetical protein
VALLTNQTKPEDWTQTQWEEHLSSLVRPQLVWPEKVKIEYSVSTASLSGRSEATKTLTVPLVEYLVALYLQACKASARVLAIGQELAVNNLNLLSQLFKNDTRFESVLVAKVKQPYFYGQVRPHHA